jgi:hypothetical protein
MLRARIDTSWKATVLHSTGRCVDAIGLVRLPSRIRTARCRRALLVAPAAFIVLSALAWGILSLVWRAAPVYLHVRWAADVTAAQRSELERRFHLTEARQTEGLTWEYQLSDASTANIRAIVRSGQVADTAHLNRVRYRPEFTQDRLRRILAYSIAVGVLGALIVSLLSAGSIRTTSAPLAWWSEIAEAVRTPSDSAAGEPLAGPHSRRGGATAAALVAGIVATGGMASLAGARPVSAAGALAALYALGYVTGSLLVGRVDKELGLSLATIRTIAGFLLSTVAFLLSLALSLPWFAGPAALLAFTLYIRGTRALVLPRVALRVRWDGLAAGILAAVLVSPIAISSFYMAPGSFPAVFYNVDTPSVLEHVHALVVSNSYPPESLSNLGARPTYHYGTQGMAALMSRSSGLLPHHSLFLIVLPLLTVGVVAAAVAAARYLAPAVPRSIAVPLLVIAVPSLSSSLWGTFGPQLSAAVTTGGFSLDALIGNFGLWGILSNEAKNVGGDFVILSSIAGIAAAPLLGRWLPAFLIGCAILVKIPAGVALIAGLILVEVSRAIAGKHLRPSPLALMAGTVFLATVTAFFLASFQSAFQSELFPLYHLRGIVTNGTLPGVAVDVAWLLLPALIVWTAGIRDPEKRSSPLLLMAIAPILVVNITRLEHVASTGGGKGDDWLQILHTSPFLFHAFALSLASRRWDRLGAGRRAAVVVTMALAIAPVVVAAGRYSQLLIRNPENGYEFVDNRSLAQALAVIPTTGTLIVTNDLRYPAEHFAREERQLQIPALFGHHAFAVNYVYEVVPFAEERRDLQRMLQGAEWSDAIPDTARRYGWTHLLIRKDYVHPAPVPLLQLFENESYVVYRFP